MKRVDLTDAGAATHSAERQPHAGAAAFAPAPWTVAAQGFFGWIVVEAEQNPAARTLFDRRSNWSKAPKPLAAEAALDRGRRPA